MNLQALVPPVNKKNIYISMIGNDYYSRARLKSPFFIRSAPGIPHLNTGIVFVVDFLTNHNMLYLQAIWESTYLTPR
ncbi:MAG: hypothetical protein D3917_08365 [Candidatus Electrothrix sp. AX5]|nr:hypothetical protein [Candidatus Electrothrix sp. AX5]